MIKNDKGFTYPLTLCLLIVFLLFFSIQINQLLSERKLEHETAVIQQQEYYLLSSVKKLEQLLQTSGTLPARGTIVYLYGTMNYQADSPSGNLQKVSFSLTVNSVQPITGIGYFDTGSKKMTKWLEFN